MFMPLLIQLHLQCRCTRFGVRVLTSVPSIPLGSILQGIKKHPNSLLSKNQASMHRAAHDNASHALFINTLLGAGEEERDGRAES